MNHKYDSTTDYFDQEDVTHMFENYSTISPVKQIDTQGMIDMTHMFDGVTRLNPLPDTEDLLKE